MRVGSDCVPILLRDPHTVLDMLQLKLEDFATLRAILEASCGDACACGGVALVLVGDPFQLPGIGGLPVYTGAASLTVQPQDAAADRSAGRPLGTTTWHRAASGLCRKHDKGLKSLLSAKNDYNKGGWLALRLAQRGTVLTEQMRAPNAHGEFCRRVRWGYTRDEHGVPFERRRSARQEQRGRGPDAGVYTTAATDARNELIRGDVRLLRRQRLGILTREQLLTSDFASAPVVTPRNEPRNAIIEQRVQQWGRANRQRVLHWRAVDCVKRGKDPSRYPTVREVYDKYQPGSGAGAEAAVANYYGSNDKRSDKDKPGKPNTQTPAKVPVDLWYAPGLPLVTNHNRATHCGWTNGTSGRAGAIVLDPREPEDPDPTNFGGVRKLQYQPLYVGFIPDNPMFEYTSEDSSHTSFANNELVLKPVVARFEWKPDPKKKGVVHILRRNFEVSPALCFTEFKVIGSTLDSVIIHLPAPALINNQTLSLQKKLVLLSRVRETKNLAFLCEDTYDFDKFLRDIKVPPDLEAEWKRLEAISTETHALSRCEGWWSLIDKHCTSAEAASPSRATVGPTRTTVKRRPRRNGSVSVTSAKRNRTSHRSSAITAALDFSKYSNKR